MQDLKTDFLANRECPRGRRGVFKVADVKFQRIFVRREKNRPELNCTSRPPKFCVSSRFAGGGGKGFQQLKLAYPVKCRLKPSRRQKIA